MKKKVKKIVFLIIFMMLGFNIIFSYAQEPNSNKYDINGEGVIIAKDRIYFPNGDVLDSKGNVYHPDGTITLSDGSIKDTNGIIHYQDGSIKTVDGTIYHINGIIEYSNGTLVDITKKEETAYTNDDDITEGRWDYNPTNNSWKYKKKENNTVEMIYMNQWIYAKNDKGEKKWYTVNREGDMIVGWVKHKGKFYYMSKKPSNRGELVQGTISIDGKRYEFDLVTGELLKGEIPTKNFEVLDENNHKSGKEGVWKRYVTGERYYVAFFDIGDKRRLEVPPSNWYMIDGNYYFFDQYGIPQTGLKLFDGKYYYLNENGVMQEGGEVIIDNIVYTFDKATGACLTMTKLL